MKSVTIVALRWGNSHNTQSSKNALLCQTSVLSTNQHTHYVPHVWTNPNSTVSAMIAYILKTPTQPPGARISNCCALSMVCLPH